MDFTAERDIAAPASAVFAVVSDFDHFVQEGVARDIRATRSDTLTAPGAGMAWRIEYRMRGADRRALSQLTAFDPPGSYAVAAQTSMLDIAATISCTPLGPSKTRLRVVIQAGPRNLSGRLLLQSVRLARGRLDARLDRALARLAERIEGNGRS